VVFAFGPLVYEAKDAAEKLSENDKIELSVINVRFIKPLDKELILNYIKKKKRVITIEDGILEGGFGSIIRDIIVSENIKKINLLSLGVSDGIVEVASREELLEKYNLNSDGIYSEVKKFIHKKRINIFKV